MRNIFKTRALLIIAFISFLFSLSCSDILEEDPKTIFTVAYFETPQGIQNALNAIYADQRYIYLPNGPCGQFNIGTDEWTYGEQPRLSTSGDNLQFRELGQYTLTRSSGAITAIWNRSFPAINQCNAVIQYAPGISELSDEAKAVIIGEARFMRGLYYFNLVTQFGAVPLDLGSGELQLNTTAFQGFNRFPVDELLVKDYQAMIDDFTFASQNLPTRRDPDNFKVTKAVALHFLAKTYLTRSYSAAAQSTDADSAYSSAARLVYNNDDYGVALQDNFEDIFRQGNDYNTEILFSVERLQGHNIEANEIQNAATQFDEKVNIANNDFIPFYTQNTDPTKGYVDGRPETYQRPLRKIAPTKWLTGTCFGDKQNDSRYHASFRTLYRCISVNAPGTALTANETAYNTYINALAALGIDYGDTCWYMPDTQAEADSINATNPNFYCLGPDDWYDNNADTIYVMNPALKKFDDTLRIDPNNMSQRPYPVARLAETYLIAAEAAMILGNTQEAADLINVLKRRAAYRPGLTTDQIDARYAAIDVDAGEIDLDYILDERARELCGEGLRWADLATRKYSNGNSALIIRAEFNPDSRGRIQPFHLIRPIPEGQINAVDDPDRQRYQNPGY